MLNMSWKSELCELWNIDHEMAELFGLMNMSKVSSGVINLRRGSQVSELWNVEHQLGEVSFGMLNMSWVSELWNVEHELVKLGE